MNKNKILKRFKEIKEMGWVTSKNKDLSGIGNTLENLFGIEQNSLEIPDLINFELKSHDLNSNFSITLFSATPDGDYLFEVERLKNTYGYPDKHMKEFKILNFETAANELNNLGSNFKQTIRVNKQKEIVKLHILTNDLELIDHEVSWSFKMLRDKFERKLRYLALIDAQKKYENKTIYFKYENISFYESYSFDRFIELLEQGIIKIIFKIGVYKKGKKRGKMHNRGVVFTISRNDLELLFKNT